ncbi:helix-turn-helix transcriptional regulator [Streptomyces chartreusis]|uniref:helix-turn-helix transcriptional regulator n=1 Tax=Streptomyces chartreusis TaxID=1969 RepID=UPI00381BD4B2
MTFAPQAQQIPVLAGLARGNRLRRIALDTSTPFRTVSDRHTRLLRGAQVPNSARLIDVAYRRGWLADLPPEPRDLPGLSDRKTEILLALAAGLTDAQIARHLHITLYTVRDHLKDMYRAMGARSRPHAVALGHQHRLFPAHSTALPARLSA